MTNNPRFRTDIMAVTACLVVAYLLSICPAAAGDAAQETFQKYRQTIKKEYGIDIHHFKESLKGGRADGQALTKYDLNELMMGIKVEAEHTKNRMQALEIATDHLEEYPDYYTRLEKMEEEAERDLKWKHKK